MTVLWCWRCRREMPMLDEREYSEARRLYGECAAEIKQVRRAQNTSLDAGGASQRFRPLREWYRETTGEPGCDEKAIVRHRLSSFGLPCRAYGKPLRTPRARSCAECGVAA